MSKRRLPLGSVTVLPPKRVNNPTSTPINFGLTLYDELVLNIFSYLTSYHDLCALQRTNTNWARLSLDNQLWRAMYIKEFGRSRLTGGKGHFGHAATRSDGREVRPLPARAHIHSESVKDWKWMFRISLNWRQGRCVSEELTWHASDPTAPIHMALRAGCIITASSSPSPSPQIFLHRPQCPSYSFTASSIRFEPSTKITALALDQAQSIQSDCRLVVFYSTGHFCLFSTSSLEARQSTELSTYINNTRRHGSTSILQAVYHHPLLVTLSSAFDLTLYELPSNSNTGIRLTQTLTSFTSYPPTSLTLSHPSPGVYKLVLAYSTPTYPSHWTIAVTELTISSFTVQSTHTSSAFDLTPGETPMTPALSETLRAQYSRKVTDISCISSDGRYVVLAGAETNTVQLYRLVLRSRTTAPKLSFLRTLVGHMSPVKALCIADGRCVTLSHDGGLWIWDQEQGGVEVDSEGLKELPDTAKVIFDERRILIVLNGRIIMRRFDL